MSGIIGGVGSKSGVIGTKELDYEEGSFTVTGTNVSSQGCRYTKIGKFVHITLKFSASGGTMAYAVGGLPFTSAASFVTESPGGGAVVYQNESATESWLVYVNPNYTTFAFYRGSTGKVLTGGAACHATFTYIASS